MTTTCRAPRKVPLAQASSCAYTLVPMRMTIKAVGLFTLLAVSWVLISPAVDLPDSTGSAKLCIVPMLTAAVQPILPIAAWMPTKAAVLEGSSSDSPLYEVNCSHRC